MLQKYALVIIIGSLFLFSQRVKQIFLNPAKVETSPLQKITAISAKKLVVDEIRRKRFQRRSQIISKWGTVPGGTVNESHFGSLNKIKKTKLTCKDPAFVTAITGGKYQARLENVFLSTLSRTLPNKRVIVYDLGGVDQARLKEAYATVKVVPFPFEKLSGVCKNIKNFCWKPVCLHDAVAEFGCAFWFDSSQQILNLRPLVESIENNGYFFSGTGSAAVPGIYERAYLPFWKVQDDAINWGEKTEFYFSDHFEPETIAKFGHLGAAPGLVGFSKHSEIGMSILKCWNACARTEECAVPKKLEGFSLLLLNIVELQLAFVMYLLLTVLFWWAKMLSCKRWGILGFIVGLFLWVSSAWSSPAGDLRYDQSTLVMCMYGPGQVFEAIEYVAQLGDQISPLSRRNERQAILGNSVYMLPAFHGGREFWDFASATKYVGNYTGGIESRVLFTCRSDQPCIRPRQSPADK